MYPGLDLIALAAAGWAWWASLVDRRRGGRAAPGSVRFQLAAVTVLGGLHAVDLAMRASTDTAQALLGSHGFALAPFGTALAAVSIAIAVTRSASSLDSTGRAGAPSTDDGSGADDRLPDAMMRASEARFRAVAETSADWFWETDADFRYTFISERYEEVTGVPRAEVIGKTRGEIVAERGLPSGGREKLDELETFKARRLPWRNHRFETLMPDGTSRYWRVSATPMFDDGGAFRGFCGATTDITEEVRAEIELDRYRNHLEELVEERTAELRAALEDLSRSERLAAIGRLTATVSHELRNPLGTIQNSHFAMERRLGEHAGPVRPILSRIERSIVRCTAIIDQLLDFTRELQLTIAPTAVRAWVDEILDDLVVPAGVSIEMSIDGDLVWPFDPERMRQVLVNLVENAFDAASDGARPGKGPTVCVTAADRGGWLEIEVSDNGSGIDPEVEPRIFEPLFSTKGFGVGLGLPLVRRIVEQHGGEVVVWSRPEDGTRMTARLPVARDPQSRSAK